MFVLSRHSAWPRLRRAPYALVRYHDEGITWFPLPMDQASELSIEALTGGGYGIILRIGEDAAMSVVVAQYPSRRLARRRLQALTEDRGWPWAEVLGRGLLMAGLLFLVWFLFVLPGDLSALSARLPPDDLADSVSPAPMQAPARSESLQSATEGPAFIDDPASPPPARLGNDPDGSPAPPRR
ncbi:MAG TPA: hypothetical protein P5330_07055 [Candidatus Competibacteraceae bacterium]|nr:hypothetical protein [Candidatus Competibacteraceae bacterium]